MKFEEWLKVQEAMPQHLRGTPESLAERAWFAAKADNDYAQTNAALRSQVLNVAYVDFVPTVRQGYPTHEVEELLQAHTVQAWARDAARLHAIRQAMGFVENASDTTVRIFQDDATRDFIVKVGTGGDSYYDSSLQGALDQLVKAVSEGKYAD